MNCPKYDVLKIEHAVHPVCENGIIMHYCLVPPGTGDAYYIGDFWTLKTLCEKLCACVEQGTHDGVLDADDPRIATWLTVREAAELSGLRRRTVQWACQHGRIEGATPNPWRFTRRAFQDYRDSDAVKRRAHKGGKHE